MRSPQQLSAAAKLELDVKTGSAGPAAAAQRLRQAETPAECGRARSVLRWFSTAVLYAAFLGLVRAEAAPLPGWGASLLLGTCPSQLDTRLRCLHVL